MRAAIKIVLQQRKPLRAGAHNLKLVEIAAEARCRISRKKNEILTFLIAATSAAVHETGGASSCSPQTVDLGNVGALSRQPTLSEVPPSFRNLWCQSRCRFLSIQHSDSCTTKLKIFRPFLYLLKESQLVRFLRLWHCLLWRRRRRPDVRGGVENFVWKKCWEDRSSGVLGNRSLEGCSTFG